MFCLANCCRLCLAKDNTLVEYNFYSEDNVSYYKKLMDIAPELLVDTEVYYPTAICKKCQHQLNEAHHFLQQCFKSKELLHSYINKLNQMPNNSSYDNLTMLKKSEESKVPSYSSESNSGLMENRPIKTEIDIEDTVLLPEFVSCVGNKPENALIASTESIPFDTEVKEEVFNSEYISNHDLLKPEFVPTTVKNEPQNLLAGDSNSISFSTEADLLMETGDLESEQVIAVVENEQRNMLANEDSNSMSFHENEEEEEEGSCVEEEDLESDARTSSDEFEPIRKNEKTPRLKRYKCFKCAKKFSRHSHLLRHSRVHTGNRPFPCTTCNKSFSQLENLERHQLIHSDIKPHTCSECGKSFRDKSYFKKHIQLHEGKRYTCDVCGKKYTNSRNLIVHNRKHTGERPFECSICKNKYADPDTLRKHRKKCETKLVNHDRKCREYLQNQEDNDSTVCNIPSYQNN